MNNFPSLGNNALFFKGADVQDVSKNSSPTIGKDAAKLNAEKEKSSIESARKKRVDTKFNFRSQKLTNFEIEKSVKSSKINFEDDGSICFSDNENSEVTSGEENSRKNYFSDFDINSNLSPRSSTLNSTYKNNKKNNAQILASMTESDGALVSDSDKKAESKASRPQFRLPSLSFSKSSEVMNTEPGSARQNRSHSSRHLKLFTSGIVNSRSAFNENDSTDVAVPVSPQHVSSPRLSHADSNKNIVTGATRQSRLSITNIFGAAEVDPAEKQLNVMSRIKQSQWRISNKNSEDEKDIPPINRIGNSVRKLLVDDYHIIVSGNNFQPLPVFEREPYLKEELSVRLISHVLRDQGDDFDPALLSSFSKLSAFMKKKFGIIIEKKNTEKEFQSNKNTDEITDYLQVILDDVVLHSKDAHNLIEVKKEKS